MKLENLCNLDHYVIPSPSAAASGISTSLKRSSYFLLSLGALRHYHNHGRLIVKPAQIRLYKRPLTQCIKHLYRHRNSYMLGLGVIVLVSCWETVPYSKRRHLVIIPASKDKRFGDYLSKNQDEDKILPLDHPHSVRVRSISNKILQALQSDLKIKQMSGFEFGSMNNNVNFDEKDVKLPWWRRTKFSTRHLEGLNWEIVVSDNYSCGAYCRSGGRIVVYKGLLQLLKSDAEIAAVIGHEVAHVVARHSAERRTTKLLFLIRMLIIPLGSSAEVKKLGKLILNPIRQRNEMEADYIGLLLMASAGYDPRVAPKMYEMLGHDDSFESNSHPSGKKIRGAVKARSDGRSND
ncbi:mitochondrial metalloendopeptidase OMA1-like [Apium graveolens]|uniref:mitochondrial metalloendopeptidase OMA1-like n=1 Tax=Apium graveolens TaxID=4045 RepID=UPI003D793747